MTSYNNFKAHISVMFYKFLVLEKYYLVRIFIDFIFPGSLCEEIDIL